jgi:energy-coupling factor transporter ATP-binding protein EcfA2
VSDAPAELKRLLRAIKGGLTADDEAQQAICPWRGLDAFREEDSAFFYGRGSVSEPESPIGELVRKVREHRFVMVVGRSGSGKSSLVFAGLVPALRRDRNRIWNVLTLRPGPSPLRALAAAFNLPAENEGAAGYETKISREANQLRTGDLDLLGHMVGRQLDGAEGKPDRLLLYIDQWEELYAQVPASTDQERTIQSAADVSRFIDLLLTAARTAPVTVVGTVRADFYDPLIGHPDVRALLPTRQVLLARMSRSELESTIVEPANKVGLAFDPGLVQRRGWRRLDSNRDGCLRRDGQLEDALAPAKAGPGRGRSSVVGTEGGCRASGDTERGQARCGGPMVEELDEHSSP